jgi:hypothetical protein
MSENQKIEICSICVIYMIYSNRISRETFNDQKDETEDANQTFDDTICGTS